MRSVQRLWSEILVNLTKDIHRRLFIQFSNLHHPPPPPPLPSASSGTAAKRSGEGGSANGSGSTTAAVDTELIAFTCGHVFGRSYFAGELLPEFVSRIGALEPPIPITAKLITAEYQNVLTPPPALSHPPQHHHPPSHQLQVMHSSFPHSVVALTVASVAASSAVIALSCPLCLYHTLTQQHIKTKSQYPHLAPVTSGPASVGAGAMHVVAVGGSGSGVVASGAAASVVEAGNTSRLRATFANAQARASKKPAAGK